MKPTKTQTMLDRLVQQMGDVAVKTSCILARKNPKENFYLAFFPSGTLEFSYDVEKVDVDTTTETHVTNVSFNDYMIDLKREGCESVTDGSMLLNLLLQISFYQFYRVPDRQQLVVSFIYHNGVMQALFNEGNYKVTTASSKHFFPTL